MKSSIKTIFIATLITIVACNNTKKEENKNIIPNEKTTNELIAPNRFTLAQWSYHKELFSGEMSNFDFINEAAELGFMGVEYVNQFFFDKAEDTVFLDSLKAATANAGIKSMMIMIDNEGDFGTSDIEKRNIAVENHKKWVKAAQYLGCETIRINARGEGTPDEIKNACIDGIGRLAKWAKNYNIKILIENHGGISNNGQWLTELIDSLSVENDNIGILLDFNNWCIERENGQLWSAPCIKEYDSYKGMKELTKHAHSISLKSFEFDSAGNETTIDYSIMFDIIEANKYKGWLAVEYEGTELKSKIAVQKTLNLAKKQLNQER